MALITCKDLTLGYENTRVAEHLSFTVPEGAYLCIVGENGSGKSTLMKTLLGLRAPLAGIIAFGDGLRKNEIGYLPQQTPIQRDFPASVQEVVLSGCLSRCGLRPFYTREEKALAAQNMARLGITDLARRCYRELSGGQQQRALLARALCATRKLLLLDEPVAGLDPKVTPRHRRGGAVCQPHPPHRGGAAALLRHRGGLPEQSGGAQLRPRRSPPERR